uniref:Uncharacterized protein n=1 Tax=Anguilla anguilla TaxID=7936 RepID=A0A0E9SZ44_ANGAN
MDSFFFLSCQQSLESV